MATDTQLEAQRLVSISLSKMAQSRTQKTGISLHKSLLVATVLQKARFLCMEEVFRMVHGPYQSNHMNHDGNQCFIGFQEEDDSDDDQLVGLTPEEAGITNQNSNYIPYPDVEEEEPCSQNCIRHEPSSDCDKENLAPETPTYFDLDRGLKDQGFRERSASVSSSSSSSYCRNLKRRRAACDSETEEVIQSTVPKKTRTSCFDSDCDDSVFSDDDPFLDDDSGDDGCKSMDIDRITSLVSIFSFGGLSPSGSVVNVSETSSSASNNNNNNNNNNNSFGNLARSSSTPDLCSAQAKENGSLQQRAFIAMTV